MILTNKTVSGLIWGFTENVISYGVQFVVGIILTRLLLPSKFNCIDMVAIFIVISRLFINSDIKISLIKNSSMNIIGYSLNE